MEASVTSRCALWVGLVAACAPGGVGDGAGPEPTAPPSPGDSGAPVFVDAGLVDCASVAISAESTVRPVDIVWVVDSSGSMSNEAERVQENMNRFAADILDAGIDPRVVVITDSDYVTVPPPLGTDPEHYRFIDEHVGSHEPLEALVTLFPRYGDFLRPEAGLHFVAVTDDESDMRADEFDATIRGALGGRSYAFHAIASENLGGRECDGAASPGDRYYELAAATMGLTISICTRDWTGVFDRLREHVLDTAPLPCEFLVPDPPADLALDVMRVNVSYTSGAGTTSVIPYVGDAGVCSGPGWYYDDPRNPATISLCAASCDVVGADHGGRVDITLGCETVLL
jgi:hypothetical protein